MAKVRQPVFNNKNIATRIASVTYKIKYAVFKSEEDTTEMNDKDWHKAAKQITRNGNQACFAQLRTFISQNSYDRVRFFCNPNHIPTEKLRLNEDEIRRWTELCKQNKLMPDNIGENFIQNGIYDIKVKDVPIPLIYIHLCSARYVQEEPYYVRAVLYLHDDNKMGFFTALGVATKICTYNAGHHFLNESRSYSLAMANGNLDTHTELNNINLTAAARLARVVNSDNIPAPKYNHAFGLDNAFNAVKFEGNKRSLIVRREDLCRKRLEFIIRSGKLDAPLIVKRKKSV